MNEEDIFLRLKRIPLKEMWNVFSDFLCNEFHCDENEYEKLREELMNKHGWTYKEYVEKLNEFYRR